MSRNEKTVTFFCSHGRRIAAAVALVPGLEGLDSYLGLIDSLRMQVAGLPAASLSRQDDFDLLFITHYCRLIATGCSNFKVPLSNL